MSEWLPSDVKEDSGALICPSGFKHFGALSSLVQPEATVFPASTIPSGSVFWESIHEAGRLPNSSPRSPETARHYISDSRP